MGLDFGSGRVENGSETPALKASICEIVRCQSSSRLFRTLLVFSSLELKRAGRVSAAVHPFAPHRGWGHGVIRPWSGDTINCATRRRGSATNTCRLLATSETVQAASLAVRRRMWPSRRP